MLKIILLSLLIPTCIIQTMDKPAPQVSWGQWFKTKLGWPSRSEQATSELIELFAKMITKKRDSPYTFDPAPYLPNVKNLLDLGANPNEVFEIETVHDLHNYSSAPTQRITRGTGLSFLQWAQRLQAPQLSELLLSKKASLHSIKSEKLLFTAVRQNRPDLVQILLKQGVDPNALPNTQKLRFPALWYAIENNELPIARLLLEYGANPNITHPIMGASLLYTVIRNRQIESMKLLLEYGANPNLQDHLGYTALSGALDQTHLNDEIEPIIRLLLENGADPKIKNRYGKDALEIARENNASDNVIELLSNRPQLKKLGLKRLP